MNVIISFRKKLSLPLANKIMNTLADYLLIRLDEESFILNTNVSDVFAVLNT